MAILLMVSLLVAAAIVVDVAALRQDRRGDRLASDAAAAAGVTYLDPLVADSVAACTTAWQYAVANLPDEDGSPTAPNCADTFVAACTTATPARTAIGMADPYRIEITNPVPDDSGLMKSEVGGGDRLQTANAEFDGSPCQRMAVRIVRRRPSTFGAVAGIRQQSTDVHSVATAAVGGLQGELVPLVVLDPTGCDALLAKGGGNPAEISGVLVHRNGDTPGIIVVDSKATASGNSSPGCANANSYAIDAAGQQNAFILAESSPTQNALILSHALAGSGSAHAYDPGDVPPTDDQVKPTPTLIGRQITRRPVDHRYNCNPGPPPAGNDCPRVVVGEDYITQLKIQYGGTGSTPPVDGTFGSGWQTYANGVDLGNGSIARCKTQGADPAIVVPPGNWFVDCRDQGGDRGFEIDSTAGVTFQGGNVVFRDRVAVGSQGHLRINSVGAAAGSPSIVFLRNGNLEKGAQASVTMETTSVYLANGVISIGGGGTGALTWLAPNNPAYVFDDLALWSEKSGQHELQGSATLSLEGVMFMPNATPFLFSGKGANIQTRAQFITNRLLATGQGLLEMSPEPNRVVLIPLKKVRLIR